MNRPTTFSVRLFHVQRPCLAEHSNKPQSPNDSSPARKFGKLKLPETIRENIYTLPNLLTVSRILACPVLGYYIVQDNFIAATSLLVYAGLTDLVCVSFYSLFFAFCACNGVF